MKREASDEYAEIKALPSLKHRLMSGSAWALGGRAVTVVTALATNALLARLLPPRDLGAYFLAFSVVLIGGAVGQLGLGQAAVRFLAESIALGRLGRVRRTVAIVLCLGGLGASSVALAYLLLGNILSTRLFHAPALAAVTGLVAGWMAAMALQNLLAETFRGFHDIRLATAFNSLIAGVL